MRLRLTAGALIVLGAATPVARLNAQTVPHGQEFRVNTTTGDAHLSPDAAMAPSGAAIVVWASSGPEPRILGQLFEGSTDLPADPPASPWDYVVAPDLGSRSGGELEVASGQSLRDPVAAMDASGRFVVAWTSGFHVTARQFDAAGNPRGDEIEVGGYGYRGAALSSTSNGAFVVVWGDYYYGSIYGRLFDAAGVPRARAFAVPIVEGSNLGRYDPAVAIDDDERSVVVWVDRSSGGGDVSGVRIDRNGAPIGTRFQVNVHRVGAQFSPAVARRRDGSFVVVWASDAQDGDRAGIFGRLFDASASAVGGEFQVNEHTPGHQLDPDVAIGPGDEFLVTWTSDGQDGSGWGVFARHFAADGNPLGPEVQVNTLTAGTQALPAVGFSADGALVAWQGDAPGRPSTEVVAKRFRTGPDIDFDGVANEVDNCPTRSNPDQLDGAGDGFGDDCVSPEVFLPGDARFGAAPVIQLGASIGGGVELGDFAVIGAHARLDRQVAAGYALAVADLVAIGRGTTIGNDVTIRQSTAIEPFVVLGDRVRVGEHAYLRRGAIVGDGAIIGAHALLGASARVGEGATIGMGASVARRATVLPGAEVPPGVRVPPGTTYP